MLSKTEIPSSYNSVLKKIWNMALDDQLNAFSLEGELTHLLPFRTYIFIWDNQGQTYFRLTKDPKDTDRYMGSKLSKTKGQKTIQVDGKLLHLFPLSPLSHTYTSANSYGFFVVEGSNDLSSDILLILEKISEHIPLLIEITNKSQHLEEQLKNLTTIVQIDSSISVNADFETTLRNIIEKFLVAFNASKGGVMLYDETKRSLILQKPSFNASDEDIEKYKVSLLQDNSNAARVFRTGVPLLSNKCIDDERIMQQYVNLYNVSNLLSVPLVSEGKNIGVLHIANKKTGNWTQSDLKLLQMMASHLGGIIERAVLTEDLKKNNREIQKLYQSQEKMTQELICQKNIIQEQHASLEWILSIHNRLLKTILEKGGVHGLAKVLAKELGKSVIVIDKFFQIIAASFFDKVHETVYHYYTQKNNFDTGETVRIKLHNHKYYITPFLIDFRGYNYAADNYSLLVIARDNVDRQEINALQQASIILSLEMMRQKSAIETERKIKSDFFNDLLFSKPSTTETSLHNRAAYLNHDFKKPNMFIILDIDEFASLIENKNLKEEDVHDIKNKLSSIAEHAFNSYIPDCSPLITEISGKVLVLLPSEDCNPRYLLKHTFEEIQTRAAQSLHQMTISIGISKRCASIEDYRENFFATQKALDIYKSMGKKNFIIYQDEPGITELYFDLYQQERFRTYCLEFLKPLLEYEKRKQTPLIETVETYLDNLSFKQTAGILYCHVNTIRYRLQKAETLLKMSFNSKDDRLKLGLALSIFKFNP